MEMLDRFNIDQYCLKKLYLGDAMSVDLNLYIYVSRTFPMLEDLTVESSLSFHSQCTGGNLVSYTQLSDSEIKNLSGRLIVMLLFFRGIIGGYRILLADSTPPYAPTLKPQFQPLPYIESVAKQDLV